MFNYRSNDIYEEEPPLSWHLTDAQKAKLNMAWSRSIGGVCNDWQKFKYYLERFKSPPRKEFKKNVPCGWE